MDEELKEQRVKLVRFNCPPELFDTTGAYILRRKRVAVWKLDAIKASKDASAEVYPMMAELVPQWHGVLDVDTGQPLPHPGVDAAVLSHLDTPQLTWIVKMLQASPDANPTPDRT